MSRFRTNRSRILTIITFILCLALLGGVIGLAVKLDRQTSINKLGGEAYSIGAIDEKGEYKESSASIYTRKGVTVDGLKCELQEDAKIKYQLFFYDKDGKFVSASSELTSDFNGSETPATAKTVKIVITPTADEDGKVGLTEVLGYAGQLNVQYSR